MINYPNGKKAAEVNKEKQNLRFGSKKKRNALTAGNRGMDFEADINDSNEYYTEHEMALVTKRPTPINIVKVDYSKGAKIVDAYFEKQSTTDYNGVYKGRYLDFEAKSTKSKTAIPLINIAPQQVKHLRSVKKNGGIAFFLIRFEERNEVYCIDADFICDFYDKRERKSIPYETIKEHGYLVKESYHPRIDYLPIIEEHFLK